MNIFLGSVVAHYPTVAEPRTLDLYEMYCIPITGNNIELSPFSAVITLDNRKPLFHKVFHGKPLT